MDVINAAITELSSYLGNLLPTEFTLIDEFPEPSEKLSYPTLSITSTKSSILLKNPYFYNYIDVKDTIATVESRYIVADVSIPIQLDLWFMSKDQRKYYLEGFVRTLFQNPARAGDINLNLTEHYNIPANYQINTDIDLQDTSDEALVSEYRAKVDLLCTTELVATKEEYKLLKLSLHTKVFIGNSNGDEEITTVFGGGN